jgi:hypothetical protein
MNKKGSSLIETMVAMVLLLIITLSSAYFFAIPPFRKEALRFAALERAAGMLDLMAFVRREPRSSGLLSLPQLFYKMESGTSNKVDVAFTSNSNRNPMPISDGMPPVWYTLHVANASTVAPGVSGVLEAELKLYDKQNDTNSLFATFKMLLPPAPTP